MSADGSEGNTNLWAGVRTSETAGRWSPYSCHNGWIAVASRASRSPFSIEVIHLETYSVRGAQLEAIDTYIRPCFWYGRNVRMNVSAGSISAIVLSCC